ncbi:MAG TPA: mechanosensitive ion channel family protein, partial [Candidatus Binataceae bacterium]|nr:mechanosensitive ion channel family protein [Candidatus Binataceae bacterium]
LIIDMMIPQAKAYETWAHVGRAMALLLVAFGLIRLATEAFLIFRFRRKADPSTIVAEIVLASLYGITALAVLRFMLGIDPRVLLAVPALGTLIVGWIRTGNFFSGLLIQAHRPFGQGDWVRLGDHLGRVVGTGWRATWVITRNNEHVQIPNAALAHQPVVNYSSGGAMVADEVYLEIDREVAPARVEQIVGDVMRGVREVLTSEVDLWEYKGAINRYRVRFWLADYASDERVRAVIARSLWYALRRNAIELAPSEPRRIPIESNGHGDIAHLENPVVLAELRRVYLLNALSDEELALVASAIKPLQFGRGEVLMHQGDEGDRFYILRKGKVEVYAHGESGAAETHIREIEDSSRENFFGEIALLTGDKRNASIRAISDIEVWEVGREAFARLFRAKPEAGTAIAEVAGRRSTETSAATHVGGHEASHTEAMRRSAVILLAMRKIFDF